MENFKNVDSQRDSAPPPAFSQIQNKINDNNNSKANLEDSNYNLFSSFPNNNIINNSNNINQNKIIDINIIRFKTIKTYIYE